MANTQQKPRAIIITSPDGLEQDWLLRLSSSNQLSIIESVGVVSSAIELIRAERPDLVLIQREVPEAEQLIHQIQMAAPTALCIAIVPMLDVPTLRQLMSAGARDVLGGPPSYSELMASIQRVFEGDSLRRQGAQVAAGPSQSRGRLVVAISPKGGVGTTTVATNAAIALQRISKRKVVLADFSLQFGDAGVHLNLLSKHSIIDLTQRMGEIDDAVLARVLSKHESGIHVLLVPGQADAAIEVGRREVDAVLDHLLAHFAYVIIDTWSFLDEIAETLLQRADEVLLVTTPEVPALKSAKRFLAFIQQRQLIKGRVTIVLNRFPSVEGIAFEDLQQHLQHPIGANIPSEGPLITQSINQGLPVVLAHPQSWTAQNIYKLAARLAGDQVKTLVLSADEARRSSRAYKTKGGLMRLIRRST